MASPIDDLFFSIYGYRPNKDGQAYEMLLAAAFKLLEPNRDVGHDKQIRGEISETKYQVDALKTDGEAKTMGEAKDYTAYDRKVGRSDVQKLAGALPDLQIESGVLASATGFTKPAIKYAAKAKEIVGSDISLWEVRPVVDGDMEGRLQTIIVNMHVSVPDYERAKFDPVWTAQGREKLLAMVQEGIIGTTLQMTIGTILRGDGTLMITLHDLTVRGFGDAADGVSQGSFVLRGGHIRVKDTLIPVHGITYNVPYKETEVREIVIRADGTATLLTRSLDGQVDKVIRDADLKRVLFSEDGQVTLKPKGT